MQTVELEAVVRSNGGKGPARRLRQSGKAPAVFYGPKRQATMIAIDAKEFLNKVSALEGSHLIRFRSTAADLAEKVALVKETQYHPVTGAVLHADFYEVDLTAKAARACPAPLHRQSCRCRAWRYSATGAARCGSRMSPGDIPEFFNVDVSALEIHDAIHVSELQAPEGSELSTIRMRPW